MPAQATNYFAGRAQLIVWSRERRPNPDQLVVGDLRNCWRCQGARRIRLTMTVTMSLLDPRLRNGSARVVSSCTELLFASKGRTHEAGFQHGPILRFAKPQTVLKTAVLASIAVRQRPPQFDREPEHSTTVRPRSLRLPLVRRRDSNANPIELPGRAICPT